MGCHPSLSYRRADEWIIRSDRPRRQTMTDFLSTKGAIAIMCCAIIAHMGAFALALA